MNQFDVAMIATFTSHHSIAFYVSRLGDNMWVQTKLRVAELWENKIESMSFKNSEHTREKKSQMIINNVKSVYAMIYSRPMLNK